MAGTRLFYAYAGRVKETEHHRPELEVADWSNAHAIVLELDEWSEKLWAKAEAVNVGVDEIGPAVLVRDSKTGDRYLVASAPCGQECHCAAVAARRDLPRHPRGGMD